MWVEHEPDLQYHAYEIYYNVDNTFRMSAYHSHDFYELHLFIGGVATMYIEEFSHALEKGDMHVILPGRLHRLENIKPSVPYERAFLYISREQVDALSTSGFPISAILDRAMQQHQYAFKLPPELFGQFQQFMRATTFDQDARPYEHIINRSTLTILLARLCRLAEQPHHAMDMEPTTPIQQVIRYINEHFAEPITIELLSELFYISRYHLMREFKQYTTISPHQYLLSKRLIFAKSLLTAGVAPPEAAARCGFSDYSCFYKAFRKAIGCSPRAFAVNG